MLSGAFYGSWLAYLIITFALGFLWHLVVFKDLYRRLAIYTRIDDPIVPRGRAMQSVPIRAQRSIPTE